MHLLKLLQQLQQLQQLAVPHPWWGRGGASAAASFDEWHRLKEARRREKEETRREKEERRRAKEERRASPSHGGGGGVKAEQGWWC